MIVYFVLPYFVYYDLHNWCYGIIFRHFGPNLKLLLWWDCSYSILGGWLGHNCIYKGHSEM